MRSLSFYLALIIGLLLYSTSGFAQNKEPASPTANAVVKTDSLNLAIADTLGKNIVPLSKKEKRRLNKLARRNYVLADSLNPYRPNNTVKRAPYNSQPEKAKTPDKPLFDGLIRDIIVPKKN
jgi:hypothetical protein